MYVSKDKNKDEFILKLITRRPTKQNCQRAFSPISQILLDYLISGMPAGISNFYPGRHPVLKVLCQEV